MASSADTMARAEALHKAMKGLGTDDSVMIDVMCGCDYTDRMAIVKAYWDTFQQDLVEEISSETSGNYKKLLTGLASPFEVIVADIAKEGGKKDLIDVLAHLTNAELESVRTVFESRHKKSLEKCVSKSLTFLVDSRLRDETVGVNMFLVNSDVDELYRRGQGKTGTDEEFFEYIFRTRSIEHLRALDKAYQAKYERTLVELIKKEFSGTDEDVLLALATPKVDYWTDRFHDAIDGMGTDDALLVRGLLMNSRESLAQIDQLYLAKYEKGLIKAINGDTSGDYKKAAVALCQKSKSVVADASGPTSDGFSAATDAVAIYEAIKGMGTDDKTLINIMCTRTYEQRMEIRQEYKTRYEKDLNKDIKDDTSGDYGRLLCSLAINKVDFVTQGIKKANGMFSTDSQAIIDLLAHLNNKEIMNAVEQYEVAFSKPLLKEVPKAIHYLLRANRDESTTVNEAIAKADIIELYERGQKRQGKLDVKFFAYMLCNRSHAHLTYIRENYAKEYDMTLPMVIAKKSSGDNRKALYALACTVPEFWTSRFHDAISGVGTNEATLIRGLSLLSTQELKVANGLYLKDYEESLVDAIKDDTSDDFEDACVKRIMCN